MTQHFESPAEPLYALGHSLMMTDPSRAADLFRLLIQEAPHDERGWLGLSHCHERLEQPEVAHALWALGQRVLATPFPVGASK